MNENGLVLTDAVRPIERLLLDCGVPPRVEEKHVIGSGKVQTDASRLERDEKNRDVVLVLKPVHYGPAIPRRAVEPQEGDARPQQTRLHQVE